MRKNILVVALIIMIGGVGFWWYQSQEIKEECKNNCHYRPLRDPSNLHPLDSKGDYWSYGLRDFETQDQCLDYCFKKRKIIMEKETILFVDVKK